MPLNFPLINCFIVKSCAINHKAFETSQFKNVHDIDQCYNRDVVYKQYPMCEVLVM